MIKVNAVEMSPRNPLDHMMDIFRVMLLISVTSMICSVRHVDA